MADKLDMKSMDITQDNIAKIKALFPSAVTEVMGDDGKVKLAIDFDCLKQELSDDLISERAERYQMTWPEKSKTKVLANSRITATLRPDKEKSVDFDHTENLYIEGDNLDVLKLLQETYLHKIDIIYIDPPYNTGNNLIYKNDFAQDAQSFLEDNNSYDAYGNRLVKNLDSDGRFHTNWLNMLYPRLVLAKNLHYLVGLEITKLPRLIDINGGVICIITPLRVLV
jgi:adenine-specific DNA-methyltransferase